MSDEHAQLFVYGTLMLADTHEMGAEQRLRLAAHSRFLGPANTKGQLFDLGAYPGLVEHPSSIVHGELYDLPEPERIFRWLDPYEGIDRDEPGQAEYARVQRQVWLDTGRGVMAWTYLYIRPVDGARLIPSGRWTTR